MSVATRSIPRSIGALFPVLLVVVNSFKSPLSLPTPGTFDPVGYTTVLNQSDFIHYFQNSLVVTITRPNPPPFTGEGDRAKRGGGGGAISGFPPVRSTPGKTL